jgi:hypothetical protein
MLMSLFSCAKPAEKIIKTNDRDLIIQNKFKFKMVSPWADRPGNRRSPGCVHGTAHGSVGTSDPKWLRDPGPRRKYLRTLQFAPYQ